MSSGVRFVRNSEGMRALLLSEDVERMLQVKADRVKEAAEAKGVTVHQGRVTTTVNLSGSRTGAVVLSTPESTHVRTGAVGESGPGNRRITRTGGTVPMPYDTEVHRSPTRVRVRVRAVHPAGARAEAKHRALGQSIDAAR